MSAHFNILLMTGLSTETGPCSAGYFCNAGSDRADPTDGIMGNVCPAGRYCGIDIVLLVIFFDKKGSLKIRKNCELKQSKYRS